MIKRILNRIFNVETLGMLIQLLLWVLAFYVFFSVLTVGFDFGEFRYVGY